ncbi:MAG: C39 family peptidase [Patescibacteria group bacterium]
MLSFIIAIFTLLGTIFPTPVPAQSIPVPATQTITTSSTSTPTIPVSPSQKISASSTTPPVSTTPQPIPVKKITSGTPSTSTVPHVPFYSQFKDITSVEWKKVGCGIASLAMVLDYYKPAVSVNTLLQQGIDSGAYLKNAGWTYKGLIGVAKRHGLDGTSYDLGKSGKAIAFEQFKKQLANGPVIASVHYKFDPQSTIPHLVVINGMSGDSVYYNDPAANGGEKIISSDTFLKAWKKRFIVIRPVDKV